MEFNYNATLISIATKPQPFKSIYIGLKRFVVCGHNQFNLQSTIVIELCWAVPMPNRQTQINKEL